MILWWALLAIAFAHTSDFEKKNELIKNLFAYSSIYES